MDSCQKIFKKYSFITTYFLICIYSCCIVYLLEYVSPTWPFILVFKYSSTSIGLRERRRGGIGQGDYVKFPIYQDRIQLFYTLLLLYIVEATYIFPTSFSLDHIFLCSELLLLLSRSWRVLGGWLAELCVLLLEPEGWCLLLVARGHHVHPRRIYYGMVFIARRLMRPLAFTLCRFSLSLSLESIKFQHWWWPYVLCVSTAPAQWHLYKRIDTS